MQNLRNFLLKRVGNMFLAPDDGTNGGGNGADSKSEDGGEDKTKLVFTEEQNKHIQSLIDGAYAKAYGKAQKEFEDKQAKQKEQDRINALEGEEKWKAEKEQLMAELNLSKTKDLLSSKGLPTSLAAFLTGKDAENTAKNIEAYEIQYKKDLEDSVSRQVAEKLKGSMPPLKNGNKNHTDTEQDVQNQVNSIMTNK